MPTYQIPPKQLWRFFPKLSQKVMEYLYSILTYMGSQLQVSWILPCFWTLYGLVFFIHNLYTTYISASIASNLLLCIQYSTSAKKSVVQWKRPMSRSWSLSGSRKGNTTLGTASVFHPKRTFCFTEATQTIQKKTQNYLSSLWVIFPLNGISCKCSHLCGIELVSCLTFITF